MSMCLALLDEGVKDVCDRGGATSSSPSGALCSVCDSPQFFQEGRACVDQFTHTISDVVQTSAHKLSAPVFEDAATTPVETFIFPALVIDHVATKHVEAYVVPAQVIEHVAPTSALTSHVSCTYDRLYSAHAHVVSSAGPSQFQQQLFQVLTPP